MIPESPSRIVQDDACSGVKADNLLHSDPGEGIKLANEILFGLSLFYFLSTFIWSWQYRHTKSVFSSVRPYPLVVSLLIPCILAVFAVPGRFILPFMSKCRVHYFLLMMVAPTYATVYTLRLLMLISKASQVALSRILTIEELDRISHRDKKHTNFLILMRGLLFLPDLNDLVSGRSNSPKRSFVSVAGGGESNASKFTSDSLPSPVNSSQVVASTMVGESTPGGMKSAKSFSYAADPKKINALIGMLKIRRHYLFIVLLILLTPVILSTAILFTSKDVFIGDCDNCAIYYEFLIVLVASVFLEAILALMLIFKLRTYPDHQGSWMEIKIILFSTTVIALLTSILLLVDPGDYQKNHLVQWEWFLYLLLVISWTTSVVYRVYLARQDSIELKKALSDTEWTPDIEVLDKDDETAAEWNFYVRNALIDETWRFLKEVEGYKAKYDSMDAGERKHRVVNIINTFIAQEAPLQINIDASRRKEIEKNFNEDFKDCNMFEIFDKSHAEVKHLIIEDGWKRFLSKNPEAMQRLKKLVMQERLGNSKTVVESVPHHLRTGSKNIPKISVE